MKLLEDPWIPVGSQQSITLQTLLTEEGGWQLSLPRDDMEMACLQLLVRLAQALFTPPDRAALRQRLKTPLTTEDVFIGSRTLAKLGRNGKRYAKR
jgi:CRISPR system Cascade subunit CasA